MPGVAGQPESGCLACPWDPAPGSAVLTLAVPGLGALRWGTAIGAGMVRASGGQAGTGMKRRFGEQKWDWPSLLAPGAALPLGPR